MFTIFFAGEKLAFLDSFPKGQNMDPYYFCNTALEGVKVNVLAGTQRATLRDFHIRMDNCKVYNSQLTKGKLGEVRLIRWDHPHIHPYCTLGLLVFRLEQKRDERTSLLE
jgi:hypothetical protein